MTNKRQKNNKKVEQNNFVIKYINDDTIRDILNDENLFRKFLNKNKGFIEDVVLSVIKRDRGYVLFDDLVQVGRISMWKALQKFTPNKKGASSFSTFAYIVISNDVKQELKKENRQTFAGKGRPGQVSFEMLLRKFDSLNSVNDYAENRIKETKQMSLSKNFETDICNDIVINDRYKSLSELEKKIYKLRVIENRTLEETAQALPMNTHTFKSLYYSSIKNKFSNIGKGLND